MRIHGFNDNRFSRSAKPILAIVILMAACGGVAAQQAQGDSRRPNVIVLLADDLGYGELSCQGNPQIPTPNIDSLAKNGIRFTNGYVTASYCSPSRAGLMTGRYQTRFGYELNSIGAQNEDPTVGLPVAEVTLAQHLHDGGYVTGLVGKWHLGGTAAYQPLRRGFDEYFGFLHEGHFYVPPPYHGVTTMFRCKTLPDGSQGRWIGDKVVYSTHLHRNEDAYDADNPVIRGGQPVEEQAYLTDAFTREAVDFIDRHAARPFFLYLAYNAVHSPLQGADSYMERFSYIKDIHRRIFAAMLGNLDDSVGVILNKLREKNLEENTIIFFISDNGGITCELTSSNLPLRGGKGHVYEGGIRVPFLVQWKGRIPAGQEYHKPVISLDVYTTAAAISGIPVPKSRRVDGVNLLPYLTGERDDRPHEILFWRRYGQTAVRVGDWKLLHNSIQYNDRNWELYCLADDISETKNLAKSHPQKVQELKEVWTRLNDEMASPSPRAKR